MHGFDFSTWFAVGHVREAGYRGYDAYNDARNFSQTALLPLVKHVARKGGFLVRLGTKEQSHIPKTREFLTTRARMLARTSSIYISWKNPGIM